VKKHLPPTTEVRVACADPARQDEADALAIRLNVQIIDSSDTSFSGYRLILTQDRIELLPPPAYGFTALNVSFNEGHAAHRLRFGGGRGQSIARACGLKSGNTPTILDLTAGLGRDAFVLASLGCQVTMLERNPVIAVLLEDGLRRAVEDPEIGPWVSERLQLVHCDASEYLAASPETDVIYLDPMFPERKKSAQVKKEMQIFHDVVGDDEDAATLLEQAEGVARQRVVVKRPRLAEPLGQKQAPACVTGKTTRYDIYPVT
jgi:16S rRNA (guanine1516-N2)-methyltransferase